MKNYLGETEIDICKTKYAMYSQNDWALLWIEMYSGIDGAHHKDWLLDQVARILNGCKVICKIASWSDGQIEERFSLQEPTKEYNDWVMSVISNDLGEVVFDYSTGIAP